MRLFFAAVLALTLVVTGFGALAHVHSDKAGHGDGLTSCSVCRLAHETSSGPVAPSVVAEPLRLVAQPAHECAIAVSAPVSFEHSPRAPPCLASC